mgnify:CR=1 FL=1
MSFLINGEWVETDDKNEYCKHSGIIFKRKKNVETIPVDCPVCKIMLITVEDIQSFKRVECCEKCELMYYYPNREKWKKGWRPNLSSKDIISN